MMLTIDKESVLYQSGLLGLITGVATLFLLGVYNLSAPIIAVKKREDQLMGLDQVLPPSLYSNDLLSTQVSFQHGGKTYQMFTAQDENATDKGYALQSSVKGFSGPITVLMGLDENLTIIGVRVLSHSETPGLGDKIEIGRDDWIRSFEGLSLNNTPLVDWAVKKDGGKFDQFTGATITPRAVVRQVHEILNVIEIKAVNSSINSSTHISGEANDIL